MSSCANLISIPGATGAGGSGGANGTDGINAVSHISGGATLIPANSGDTVGLTLVETDGSDWMTVGQYVQVGSDTSGYGIYKVKTITDGDSIVLTNMKDGSGHYPDNVTGNGVLTFAANTRISPSGPTGPDGTAAAGVLLAANNLADVTNVATSRTSLGLGTMAVQASGAVSITGGAITGITDLAVADGGTGASAAAGARTNLGAAASGLATASGLTTSATDKVIGRSSVGAGAVEEIACTATGRSIIAAASLAAAQTYLGIGYRSIVTKIAGYTATVTDNVILCDATAGAITIDLPAAATASGKVLVIKKIDATANTVTIDGDTGDLIDGAATQVISAQWTAIEIVCNGTAWYII